MHSLDQREVCPVCGSALHDVVLDLPYDDGALPDYLHRFYEGRLNPSLVAGQRYVLDRCRDCTLLYQRFVPAAAMLELLYGAAAFASEHEITSTRGLSVRQQYSFQVEQMIRYWGRSPSSLRVLDFGAGAGLWLKMVDAYGCEPHAAELSAGRAADLQARGITFHALDALPSETFHFINAEQVFEHLVDPRGTIRLLAGALVPGGLLRIAVPNGTAVESLLADPDWGAAKGTPGSLNAVAPLEHINTFTHESLVRLGEQASLRPFNFPLRQFMHPTERARFIASAVVHSARRRKGTMLHFQRIPENAAGPSVNGPDGSATAQSEGPV
jgi:SAM-dependent methyltransferase